MKRFSDIGSGRRARTEADRGGGTDLALERSPRPEKVFRGAFSVTRSEQTLEGVTYLTVRSPRLREGSGRIRRHTEDVLATALAEFVGNADRVLVVGLGNRGLICDALGPLVADGIVAGRGETRSVFAFSPGVAGMTGMDTHDAVRAIADAVSPDLVIAVDALCARDVENLGACFQLSTGGIAAGSGVAAHNLPLSRATLGVSCLACGVPTVIRAGTLLRALPGATRTRSATRANADGPDADRIADLLVTPKDVDATVSVCAGVLATALNRVFARPPRSDGR